MPPAPVCTMSGLRPRSETSGSHRGPPAPTPSRLPLVTPPLRSGSPTGLAALGSSYPTVPPYPAPGSFLATGVLGSSSSLILPWALTPHCSTGALAIPYFTVACLCGIWEFLAEGPPLAILGRSRLRGLTTYGWDRALHGTGVAMRISVTPGRDLVSTGRQPFGRAPLPRLNLGRAAPPTGQLVAPSPRPSLAHGAPNRASFRGQVT